MRRALSILVIVAAVGWMVFGCGTTSRTQKEAREKKTERKAAEPRSQSSADTSQMPAAPVADSAMPQPSPPPADSLSLIPDTTAAPVRPVKETPVPADSTGREVTVEIPYEDEAPEDYIAAQTEEDRTAPPAAIPQIEEDAAPGMAPTVAPAASATGQPSGRDGLFSRPRREAGQTAPSVTDSTATAAGTEAGTTTSSGSGQGGGRKPLNFTGDVIRPYYVTPDSSITTLVNNVVIYHNGVVITCDSAVRYADRYFECFGRVVINRGTTYIYGDRADYKGDVNTATVYAPIVKLVDEDATLYTYRFSFNTLDKIARYGGGATMTQKDNMMESKRGYYYVDTKEFVGVDSVELRNPDYRMMSDSALYDIGTETAQFFTESVVWNNKGEILSAERGRYHSPSSQYRFRDNAYIVTPIREVWADTLDYNSETNDATMFGNIQFVDDEQNTMAFGDYAEYWGEREYGMLTREPSLVSFDPEQPDTLYMRSDSMFMYTFSTDIEFKTTLRPGEEQTISMPGMSEEEEMLPSAAVPEMMSDSTSLAAIGADSIAGAIRGKELRIGADSIPSFADSVPGLDPGMEEELADGKEESTDSDIIAEKEDSGPATEAAVPEREKSPEEIAKEERKAEKEEKRRLRREMRDSILNGAYDHGANKESRRKYPHDNGETAGNVKGDEVGGEDSTGLRAGVPQDTAGRADTTAVALDSLGNPIPPTTDSAAVEKDSLQRVFIAYRDVRMYRSDFQAVCDSLVGFSVDSTMHMYVNPVMWSGANQIVSDIMDIYTRNEELYKAEFFGSPFASAEAEPGKYNQVKGKFMEAWFRDNNIYRHDVTGNGEAYYWQQDEATKDITGLFTIVCANMAFLFENQELDRIKFYTDIDDTIYPIDRLPSPEMFLEGFAWYEDRQPKSKEDVFNRTIRPSQREKYMAIPEPQFPLSERILKHKDSMIERGIWRERNDVLSPETVEYVNSVREPGD